MTTKLNQQLIGACAVLLLSRAALGGSILFVDVDAPGGGDGTSWPTAFNDLQAALAVAVPGDQVWVAEGTYPPDGGTGNRSLAFELSNDVNLYGGFDGTEGDLSERDPVAHPTTLSGDLNGDDGPDFLNYADNSYNVVRGDSVAFNATAVLDGFIIVGGNAVDAGASSRGAGLSFDVSSTTSGLTVRDCVFQENFSNGSGGAVRIRKGTVSSSTAHSPTTSPAMTAEEWPRRRRR